MPYKDKEKQREAQRNWARKQSSDYKQKVYERGLDNKKLMVQKLNEYKLQKGCCEICGDYHPPCCFDFHHIEGKESKRKEVAQLAHKGYKWETIENEISKCYMVCSHCHRKIHAGLLELIK
jgi:hypothetical protein